MILFCFYLLICSAVLRGDDLISVMQVNTDVTLMIQSVSWCEAAQKWVTARADVSVGQSFLHQHNPFIQDRNNLFTSSRGTSLNRTPGNSAFYFSLPSSHWGQSISVCSSHRFNKSLVQQFTSMCLLLSKPLQDNILLSASEAKAAKWLQILTSNNIIKSSELR